MSGGALPGDTLSDGALTRPPPHTPARSGDTTELLRQQGLMMSNENGGTSAPAGPSPTPDPLQTKDDQALADVKQLGLVAAIGSLGYVFWIVGGMEMIERLAYYGVKAVATLYAKDPVSKGGLGINMSDFGNILMVWALIQSIVPVFTGGLSDRYGYKETIFVSTVTKIIGYLIMAVFPTFWGFFAGAVVLATGTAIFKPGIQGTLVKVTSRENSSMAWGVFYQTVNIGGFMGPLLAGAMRKMEWKYVFFACAAIISLNFIMLLLYKEPGKAERLERNRLVKDGKIKQASLISESITELIKPHVFLYLLVFSGFWFMFNALFDVLPAHIDDWVDTREIVASLFGTGGTESALIKFFVVMNKDGTEILPEGMLNLNAGLIMITCFVFAWISGLMRATTSMVIGTLMATAAIFLSGYSTAGWLSVAAILTFSIGEMLSSPKFSEFIGNFAPDDKKAMYLGFSQIPLAVGWTIEGKLGPWLYGEYGSKEKFSRELIAERSYLDATQIAEIPQNEAFTKLIELSGETKWALTQTLHDSHSVETVWNVMGVVGIISAAGIWIYGKWILTLTRK
jgi:proton-dependent oligopeptide transporter, POT family